MSKYAPYVFTCKYCGTKSNALVCPSRECLAKDERAVAQRKWHSPKLAPQPQKPCDHGLFSDDRDQLDLVEMFQEPTNEA